MKFLIVFLVFYWGTQPSFSQKLNFNVCNEIDNIELRDKCLKSSLDNLFAKKLLQLGLENKDISKSQIDVSFDIEVSRVGLFTLRNFESSNSSIYNAFNQILIDIVPLNSYKQNNRLVRSTLEFDYTLRYFENSDIEILHSGKRIFCKSQSETIDKTIEETEHITNSNSSTEDDLPFAIIENVPVFPGCEPLQTNVELKDCMSDNITSFLISNFNTDVANDLNIPDGRVRINVEFKINIYGYVIDIKASTPYPELQKEAMRVINSLPKFEPGKQKGKEVNVCYSLPIVFQVESDDKTKK